MRDAHNPIRIIENPAPESIAQNFESFLRELGGPTLFVLDGSAGGRTRAMCTLLHGNEPSGARALHGWLREGLRPLRPAICLVAAVRTALHEEPFRHRFMPGERDLNRCFRPPFDDAPGRIAEHFLSLLAEFRPEALVDIHNTSGMSPAFGVAPDEDLAHEALVARFCHRLIITDLRLGALMETSSAALPAVTVECGGARDPRSDLLAREGLRRYLLDEDVLGAPADHPRLDLYHQPVRLELEPGARISYADAADAQADITVSPELEQLNFGSAGPQQPLAWLGERGSSVLRVRDSDGKDVFGHYFSVRAGRLYPARRLKLFMVTGNPVIALSDCVFYAAAEKEHTVVRI